MDITEWRISDILCVTDCGQIRALKKSGALVIESSLQTIQSALAVVNISQQLTFVDPKGTEKDLNDFMIQIQAVKLSISKELGEKKKQMECNDANVTRLTTLCLLHKDLKDSLDIITMASTTIQKTYPKMSKLWLCLMSMS